MAKDIYDKLRILPELVKTYWMILMMIGGISTGGWQWWDKTEKEVEIEAAHKQIENIANYYHKPAKCTDCSLLLKQHNIKEH